MESPMSFRTAISVDGVTAHKRSLRWTQLAIGLVCMMAISGPRYVWALFTTQAGTQALPHSPVVL